MPDPRILAADGPGVARAGAALANGGLVAFPTETVYGLGADATNDTAVARIFEAKGRPSFNPLIVHVTDAAAAQRLVRWDDRAEALARAFWPGPLTLVLPLRADAPVATLVTAGLDTLAVRVPAGAVARAVLRAAGVPVAAPSANRSGQMSPTRAQHVIDGLGDRVEAVIDGGACEVGLESTILGLGRVPALLRPGGITQDAIEEVLGIAATARREGDAITAPGQLSSHYAPGARLRLNATEWRAGESRLGFGPVEADLNLSPGGDLSDAAANLFACLHRLDADAPEVIAVSPIPHFGLGVAINDRLSRAAAER